MKQRREGMGRRPGGGENGWRKKVRNERLSKSQKQKQGWEQLLPNTMLTVFN